MSTLPQTDKPHKREKSAKLVLRCSPELRRQVRVAAAEQDKSIEQVCVELIERGLRNQQNQSAA